MHECYAMQLLETKERHKNQKTKSNSYKGKAMKHKDQENRIVQGHRITPIT